MPQFTSQRQRRFFYAVAEGSAHSPGLTKKKAKKALQENEGRRGLPERAPKRRA